MKAGLAPGPGLAGMDCILKLFRSDSRIKVRCGRKGDFFQKWQGGSIMIRMWVFCNNTINPCHSIKTL